MPKSIHTLIVGGGQAGLAASYNLKQLKVEHIIFDKADQPAEAWRNQRWDSFTLVTPNMSFRLPGAEYNGDDPNGYMKREEVVHRFEDYIQRNDLPISYGVTVQTVCPEERGFLVETSDGSYQARNVIIANGFFLEPKIPDFSARIPDEIMQIHSNRYRNPQSLPPGAVLVVGAAQSGGQIAEELYQSGRKVYLATGGAPHAPRRYRGKDIFTWLKEASFFERSAEMFPNLPGRIFIAPLITGRDGGHSLNLHQFYRDGVSLLGTARDYEDGQLYLGGDMKEMLTRTERGEKFILGVVDEYIRKNRLDVAEEQLPELKDAYQAEEISTLDLKEAGISSILWACGFKYDRSLVNLPVYDEYGYPITQRGASVAFQGLYFLGIPFLSSLKSGFIFGVADDAKCVAEKIAG